MALGGQSITAQTLGQLLLQRQQQQALQRGDEGDDPGQVRDSGLDLGQVRMQQPWQTSTQDAGQQSPAQPQPQPWQTMPQAMPLQQWQTQQQQQQKPGFLSGTSLPGTQQQPGWLSGLINGFGGQ